MATNKKNSTIEKEPKKTAPTKKDSLTVEEMVETPKVEKPKRVRKATPKIDEKESEVKEVVLEEIIIEPKLEEEKPKDKKLTKKIKEKIIKSKVEKPVVTRYNPDPKIGLTFDEVDARVINKMNNKTEVNNGKSIFRIVFTNIVTFFNILMILIAIWIIQAIGFKVQNLLFLIVVIANTAVGIVQEIRAKNMIAKLTLMSAPIANVIRSERHVEIPINELVIDDVINLKTGKQIPADAVLVTGFIEVDESLLTGESDPVQKRIGDTIYSGSFVVSGTCEAQITAVGNDIYIQKITKQAKIYKKPKSDLMRSLRGLIIIVATIIIPIGIGLFAINANRNGMSWEIAFRDPVIVKAVTGAMVGMIPSGLFLLTSMALAVGVIRLAQNKTLVQELYCIEMLARIDTLCLDKTGTITDGSMTVKSIIEYKVPGNLSLKNTIAAFLNAQEDNNLTSIALSERFGTAKRIRHKDIISFSSSRKYSAVQFEKLGTYVLGAPEFVLKGEEYDSIKDEVNRQAFEGYRVIILAHSKDDIKNQEAPKDLTKVAMIMIEDTIRPDAIETIDYFKKSNVNVVVISGDNPLTVSKIAERAGIENAKNYISLDGVSDREVERMATEYSVFGRVSPSQKQILVRALKKAGRTVAMTGDGVNDILALKEADTSIAMASGSEAARNVSHIVLLDSNFSSMPKVVREGRRVINNVQKVATLFLTKTLFSFLLALIALASKGYYPITTSQLILIDFFVIGIPAFFLALEPNNNQVKGRFIINVIKSALPGALVVVISSLIIFWLRSSLKMGDQHVSTLIVIAATFTCLMVLYKVSKPFNRLRGWLFATMAVLIVALICLIPNILGFSPFYFFPDSFTQTFPPDLLPELDLPQTLLLLVILQAIYPLMYIMTNIPKWIKGLVKKVLDKMADV